MTAPPRCWFRWSLRTMFVVVTVFGCWLGYQVNWIRQRHAFVAAQYAQIRAEYYRKSYDSYQTTAPGLLWAFGETGRPAVHVWASADLEQLAASDYQRLKEAERLFPEAKTFSLVYEGKGVVSNFTLGSNRSAPKR